MRSRPVSPSTLPDPSERRTNRERLSSGIPEWWREPLKDAIEADSFGDLADYLAQERMRPDTEIYPAESDVFRALQQTRFDAVRAVILGQESLPRRGSGAWPGVQSPASMLPSRPSTTTTDKRQRSRPA